MGTLGTLGTFGHFWALLGTLGTFGHSGHFWALLDTFGHSGHFWELLDTLGILGTLGTGIFGIKYEIETFKNAGLQLKKSLPPFPNIGVHQLDNG